MSDDNKRTRYTFAPSPPPGAEYMERIAETHRALLERVDPVMLDRLREAIYSENPYETQYALNFLRSDMLRVRIRFVSALESFPQDDALERLHARLSTMRAVDRNHRAPLSDETLDDLISLVETGYQGNQL